MNCEIPLWWLASWLGGRHVVTAASLEPPGHTRCPQPEEETLQLGNPDEPEPLLLRVLVEVVGRDRSCLLLSGWAVLTS